MLGEKTPLGCVTLAARDEAARPPRFAPCEAARLETLSGAEEPRAKALGYGV